MSARLLVALSVGLTTVAAAQDARLPNRTYTPDQLYRAISPPLGATHHNQPGVINGHLLLAGNAHHSLWDISDPFSPTLRAEFTSPHADGEAESHSVAFAKWPGDAGRDRYLAATISGLGIDLWDLTDVTAPELLAAVELEGIDYGDNTHAVWGVFWQGDYVYVGGTNTGLHVVDASNPRDPVVVNRVPTAELGGVSAGPLFAVGNLLVVTTPKERAGLATLDISDPAAPALLDFVVEDTKSYIGAMYGRHAYLLTPFRTYDVTSDPRDIRLIGSVETEKSEYVSFADDHLFLGALRPNPGVFKFAIDGGAIEEVAKIEGRKPEGLLGFFSDDQFSVPIGNLLVISDDEVDIGSIITVHDTQRDTAPPRVDYVNPTDGAADQPTSSRVGVSFSDHIDLRSLDTSTWVLRPLDGEALPGKWGSSGTIVSFWPSAPLEPDTTYELLLPAGGLTDRAGNPLAREHRSVFATGADVVAPPCVIAPRAPTPVGVEVPFIAEQTEAGLTYRWDFGDGVEGEGIRAAHAYDAPGRYRISLSVGSRRCSAIQVVHRPLPSSRPTRSGSIALDEALGRGWVVNPDADTVAVFDLTTLEVLDEVPVGARPTAAARVGDATWVTLREDDAIAVLDEAGVERIELPWGSAPHGVAPSPDGDTVWVTLSGSGRLAAFDAATRTARGEIELPGEHPPQVRGLAVSADGARAYVTRFVSPADRGEVFVVDTEALTLLDIIELAHDSTPDAADGGRGVPNYLHSIALSPDGAQAAVPAKKDNTARGAARDGQALNTTNTVRTVVNWIDLERQVERLERRVDLDDHNMAFVATFSPVGDLLFVASLGTNKVDVLDAYDGRLVAGFATGLAPSGLALTDDGRLFVQDFLSRSLSVYDVRGLLAGTDGAAARLAVVPTVSEEPLAPEVLLGKQIFYNADSRQMSQDGYISCATCHLDGAEDGAVWDFTDRGEGLRNTIDLRGRAGTGHGPLHWSANFDEIHDFEHDIRGAFGGGGLMADADFEATGDPLGEPKAGRSAALDALAAYVSSLDRFPRSPHRAADGSMTEDAEAGAELFRRLDCLDCHSGQALTDSATGERHDVGTLTEGSGGRLGETLDGLDTPTLRGLSATPPYLHDGSAPTVRDALRVEGHGNAHLLSDAELDQLVAFLLQLENEPVELERLDPIEPPPEAMPDEEPPPMMRERRRADGGCTSAPAPGAWPWLLALLLCWRRAATRAWPAPRPPMR